MKTCLTQDCDNYVEGNTDYCASCNSRKRKEDRQAKTNALKKPVRLQKFSKKRIGENKTYKQLSKEYLLSHPYCFANLPGCTKRATQCHHLGGRGTKLNAVDTFMAICNNCHRILHDKLSATERRSRGLLI